MGADIHRAALGAGVGVDVHVGRVEPCVISHAGVDGSTAGLQAEVRGQVQTDQVGLNDDEPGETTSRRGSKLRRR